MGEKFGILRLLRIYHSTSRVKGLGFDLLLNLGAGSENHCVQKNGPQFCTFPTGYNGTQSLSVGFLCPEGGQRRLCRLLAAPSSSQSCRFGAARGRRVVRSTRCLAEMKIKVSFVEDKSLKLIQFSGRSKKFHQDFATEKTFGHSKNHLLNIVKSMNT